MHDANDKDADTCTMSVDGQSDDDGNHVSERGGDRRQECDRSNLSDASEHEHDDDEDIEDTGTVDASIAMDIEDESDDGERTMERGDPNGEQPTSDEDDDVSGVTYYRLLHGDAKGPLQSYIRDVDYHYDGLQLPVR